MISAVADVLRRNKRKAFALGAVASGYALFKYAQFKWREMEAARDMERTTKANVKLRFEQNQKDCSFTVLRLLPTLVTQIYPALDVEGVTAWLQQAKNMPMSGEAPENVKARKMEKWHELKILSFTRTVASVYLVTLITVFTHVQLNLLGRFIYLDSVVAAAARSKGGELRDELFDPVTGETTKGLSFETERKFLTFTWYLLNVGWKSCVSRVRKAASDTIGSLALDTPTSFEVLLSTLHSIRSRVERDDADPSRSFNFESYLLPPEGKEAEVLLEGGSDGSMGVSVDPDDERFSIDLQLRQLLDETRDFMDSTDFGLVLSSCLDQAFGVLEQQLRPIFFPEDTFAFAPLSEVTDKEAANILASVPAGGKEMKLAVTLPAVLATLPELKAFSVVVYTGWDEA